MATIIRFVIPACVSDLLGDKYDEIKIVNAVQSELNGGTITKSSAKRTNDWKTVKDDDGNERQVIMKRTKAGETLQAENTIGNRFDSWCTTMVTLQSFGNTPFEIPSVYVTWFEKFALLNTPAKVK